MPGSGGESRRAWRFPVILVLVVCGVSVLGYVARGVLFPAESEADPIVATVNGFPIRSSYVQDRIGEATLGEQIAVREQREQFIQSIITEELLLQSMLATDFAGERELREEVKARVAEHLIRTRIGERIHVDESDARHYYEEHQSVIRGETVRMSHIVLENRSDCERVLSEIHDAKSFAAAARKHSIDPVSGPRGGALGRVMDHSGALGFEQQMFRMQDGEMEIFDGPDSCHVVRAGERVVPPVPPYETVRERIHALLRRQQEIALLQDLVEELESRLEVRRFE